VILLKNSILRPPEQQTQFEQSQARKATMMADIYTLQQRLYALHFDMEKEGPQLPLLAKYIATAPEGSETRGIVLKLLEYEKTLDGIESLSAVLYDELRDMCKTAPYSNYQKPEPKYNGKGRPPKSLTTTTPKSAKTPTDTITDSAHE
jgi:hypothetical protein